MAKKPWQRDELPAGLKSTAAATRKPTNERM
jgi:hypothetical protein